MVLRLIQRTIVYELVRVTLLATIASSGLLTLVALMVQTAKLGLEPSRMLSITPYLIAPTLPYTLPSCLLFACTFVYGRMATTNEIIALKAGGIHVMRVIWPAILLSLLVGGFGIYLADRFIPSCNRHFLKVVFSDLQATLYTYLRQQGAITDPALPYEVYVRGVHDEKLINPIIKRRSGKGTTDMFIQAAEATLRVVPGDEQSPEARVEIRLVDGVLTTNPAETVHFEDRTVDMKLPNILRQPEQKLENLSFRGCRRQAERRHHEAHNLDFEITCLGIAGVLHGDMAGFASKVDTAERATERLHRKAREAEAEIHVRIAQALAVIPFVLLGCPISILFSRREFLQTFFICFVPILTIYYPAIVLSFNVYKEGGGDLLVTLWSPAALLSVVSLPLLRRVINC